MKDTSFAQRFGFESTKPINNDFPPSAREALIRLLDDMRQREYLQSSKIIAWELDRLSRGLYPRKRPIDYLPLVYFGWDWPHVYNALRQMDWLLVFPLCERLDERFLQSATYYNYRDEVTGHVSLEEVRYYFSSELNNILVEENLGYEFIDGLFQRRGRAHTQRNIVRMGRVLTDPRLGRTRMHHAKALRFFSEFPDADDQNCIKESLCALEACLDSVTGQPISSDFTKSLRKLQGNDPGQIPTPIVEGMVKLHAYRGSGQGVSHAASRGTRVSEIEAELVLNLVAGYITYLVDLFPYQEADF